MWFTNQRNWMAGLAITTIMVGGLSTAVFSVEPNTIKPPLKFQVDGSKAHIDVKTQKALKGLNIVVAVPTYVPVGCQVSSWKPTNEIDNYALKYTCGKRYFTIVGGPNDGLGSTDMGGLLTGKNPAFGKDEVTVGTHHPFDEKGNELKKQTFVSSEWVAEPAGKFAYRLDSEGFTRQDMLTVMKSLRFLK